jgi:hypothetical protein
MYRDLKTLWNALARNGSELFGSTLTTLAVINAFFASVFPLGFPIWLAYKLLQDSSWIDAGALGASLFGTLIWYLAHWTAFKELRVPLRYLLLLPVSDLLIGIVNLDGLIQRLTGRRTWKGRQI